MINWGNKPWIKVGAVLCAGILIFVIGFFHFGSDRIARQVKLLMDDQIETDFSMGSSTFNFFSFFPRVGVSLKEVTVAGRDDTPFVENCNLTLVLDPVKAILGEINLRQVRMEGGSVNIQRSSGGFNYQVFRKGDTTNENTADPVFTIDKAILSDLHFTYADQQQEQQYDIYVKNGTLKGILTTTMLSLQTELKLTSNHLQLGKHIFARNIPLHITGQFDVNLKHGLYTFHDLHCTVGRTTSRLSGTLRDWKTHTSYRLDMEVPDGDFADLVHVMPGNIRSLTRICRPAGTFRAAARIRGRSGNSENPHVVLTLEQNGGQLHFPQANEMLEAVQYQLRFDNGGARSAQSSSIVLNQFEGEYAGHALRAEAKIEHLNFPILDGSVAGTIPVRLLNNDSLEIQFDSGLIEIPEMEVNDLWLEFLSPKRFLESVRGRIEPRSIKLIYQDKKLLLDGGHFWLEQGEVSFDSLFFRFEKSSGLAFGTLDRVGESLQMRDPNLCLYHLDLQAHKICLDDFMGTQPPLNSAAWKSGSARFASNRMIRLPSGVLSGKIDTFLWGKRTMTHLDIDMASTPSTISGRTGFHTASGQVDADFDVYCDQQYHIDTRVRLRDVDLSEAFGQWNDFGQEVIRSNQLGGRMNGHIWLNMSIDRYGMTLPKTIHSVMGLQITDGELNRLEMLEQFSKYIHIRDLQNLRFATLRNYIEIRNGQVFIPAMFIQSNAANLTVNGVHGLDQRILYNLKINAGQVLGKQFRKFNPDLDPLPAKRDGFINLYFTIFGTTQDFQYETNKAAVKSSFRQSESIRLNALGKLKQEFGSVPDWLEPEAWKDIPEYDVPLGKPGEDPQYLDVIKGQPRK